MDVSLAPADANAVVRGFADVPGGLMPALHAIQHRQGFIAPSLIPLLADTFNVSAAEVHGVITFYKDFRTEAPGGLLVQVCRGEACQARGATRIVEAARKHWASGAMVEVEDTFCLGNCALGPSVMVGESIYGAVDESRLAAIVAGAAAGAANGVVAGTPSNGTTTEAGDRVGASPASPGPGLMVVYVPRDAAARSMGADDVAAAFDAQPGVRVVRNGSRGMLWCEPMVEIESAQGRVAMGPVSAEDAPSILDAVRRCDDGAANEHLLFLGAVHDISWLAKQQRVTFARVGVVDPRSSEDFEAHGGLAGLRAAHAMTAADVIAAVTASGLRGRGGAAFPAGIKWTTVSQTPGAVKYVVCNADEGDSGTFADRMLIEGDPFTLIEGMTIAAYAVGATEGYVYVRSEYPDAILALHAAIAGAHARGWLGPHVLGTNQAFDIHVRVGAGSYICGEETAMLESLEGKRGVVRAKPPLPAVHGLFGRPTLVNNVLTLGSVPAILAGGADEYAALGHGRSRGTQVFQLGGNIAHGGIVETAFGVTLRELIEGFGGGTASGRPIGAVQVGGPLGAYLAPDQLDVVMDYEALAAADAMLGHGGVVVFDDSVDMRAQARFAMEFCALESCGKCTPCRIGAQRGVEVIDRIAAGTDPQADIDLLIDLCEVMTDGSLCAMGGLTPLPVRSALRHFSDHFLSSERRQDNEDVRP